MKKIHLILNRVEDDFDLGTTPEVKKDTTEEKPTVEKVEAKLTNNTPDPSDKVSVDRDLLKGLLELAKGQAKEKNPDSKLEKLIESLIDSNQKNSSSNFIGARPIDIVEVDKEDILEIPAIFFAHSVSFSIYDDKRMGRTIKTPYGRNFKFKKIERTVVQSPGNRNPSYTSISAVLVYSKKEADWLRNHTLFEIKFFEKAGDARDISGEMQEALVMAWNIVQSFDENQVASRCNTANIAIDTMDFTVLRRKLAKKMALENLRNKFKSKPKEVDDYEKFLIGDIPVVTDGATHKETTEVVKTTNAPY